MSPPATAELGRSLDLLVSEAHILILAGALLSITLNAFLFRLLFCGARTCQVLRGQARA